MAGQIQQIKEDVAMNTWAKQHMDYMDTILWATILFLQMGQNFASDREDQSESK